MTPLVEGICGVPLRTPTLPPATHTNTWVIGAGRLTLVDPSSPYPAEAQRLWASLQPRFQAGERVEHLFLTHHHPDHVGGVLALQARLREAGQEVPIVAHAATAELLRGVVEVQVRWGHGERHALGGRPMRALHTPGHAPGHLVLFDEETRALVLGDMVAGVGTIAIDPSDGDLGAYLESLEALRLLRPSVLLPAHGPHLEAADTVLSFYIAHRHSRSDQIRALLSTGGAATPEELAPGIYPELPEKWWKLASRQILSHLLWLQRHGLVRQSEGRWRAA